MIKNIPLQLLNLNRLLSSNCLIRLRSLLTLTLVNSIHTIQHTKAQPRHPSLVSLHLHPLGHSTRPHPGSIQVGQSVSEHVSSISQLTACGAETDDGVQSLCVVGVCCGAEVLDEFADAHGFADEAEVGFQLGPLHDCRLGAVGAEGVPGEEAGEVLHETEGLVATHCDGNRQLWLLYRYRGFAELGDETHSSSRQTCCSGRPPGGI
jgi:hypothetical protein